MDCAYERVSVSLPTASAAWLRNEARRNHRSVSGQLSFFLAQAVAREHRADGVREHKESGHAG